MNPTTLSGKQASKFNIPLSAMFAAIVMQSVPFGHTQTLRQAKGSSLFRVGKVAELELTA